MELDKDKLFLFDLAESKEGAFQRIYEAYWEDLYTYVARILDQESEVEDIVQEVFVTLWEIKGKTSHIHSLKAYLLVMAKNSVVKYLMKRKTKKAYTKDSRNYVANISDDLEQKVIVNQLSSIIDTEIATLPSKMQQIFVLSRKNHLSHKEIAEILEISDQTVKKQINNSLKHLKHRLKNLI